MSDLDELRGRLGQVLLDLDKQLKKGDPPPAALEDLKATLDGVRTSVLALMSLGDPADYEKHVRGYRVKRAAQVCGSITAAIREGSIGPNTRGFDTFCATADETLRKLNELRLEG
jgi:hypothetical protein